MRLFYVAEALLYEQDQAFGKHSAVHAVYGKEFAKTGLLDPKYHRWLLKAFEDRLQTDYGVDANMRSEDVETVMEQAREFLAAARSFLGETTGPSSYV